MYCQLLSCETSCDLTDCFSAGIVASKSKIVSECLEHYSSQQTTQSVQQSPLFFILSRRRRWIESCFWPQHEKLTRVFYWTWAPIFSLVIKDFWLCHGSVGPWRVLFWEGIPVVSIREVVVLSVKMIHMTRNLMLTWSLTQLGNSVGNVEVDPAGEGYLHVGTIIRLTRLHGYDYSHDQRFGVHIVTSNISTKICHWSTSWGRRPWSGQTRLEMITHVSRGLMLMWSQIVLFQEFAVHRHHKHVALWIDQVVCPIRTNWHYHERSFPLGLNFSFVLCVMIVGRLTARTMSLFLKVHSLTFLLKALDIRT